MMIEKLYNTGDLSDDELKMLITSDDDSVSEKLAMYADKVRRRHYDAKSRHTAKTTVSTAVSGAAIRMPKDIVSTAVRSCPPQKTAINWDFAHSSCRAERTAIIPTI